MSLVIQIGKIKLRKLLIHSIWTRFSRFCKDLVMLQIRFTLCSLWVWYNFSSYHIEFRVDLMSFNVLWPSKCFLSCGVIFIVFCMHAALLFGSFMFLGNWRRCQYLWMSITGMTGSLEPVSIYQGCCFFCRYSLCEWTPLLLASWATWVHFSQIISFALDTYLIPPALFIHFSWLCLHSFPHSVPDPFMYSSFSQQALIKSAVWTEHIWSMSVF